MDQDQVEIREEFADRLRVLFELSEKTQDEIMKESGISQSSLSSYMDRSKRQVPTFFVLRQLAEYFRVSSDYLLGLAKVPTTIENEKIAAKTLRLKDSSFVTLYNINRGNRPDGTEYEDECLSRYEYKAAVDFFLLNDKALDILLEVYYFLVMRYHPQEKLVVDPDALVISKGFSEKDYNRMAMLRIVEKTLEFKEELGNIGGEENGNHKGEQKQKG